MGLEDPYIEPFFDIKKIIFLLYTWLYERAILVNPFFIYGIGLFETHIYIKMIMTKPSDFTFLRIAFTSIVYYFFYIYKNMTLSDFLDPNSNRSITLYRVKQGCITS